MEKLLADEFEKYVKTKTEIYYTKTNKNTVLNQCILLFLFSGSLFATMFYYTIPTEWQPYYILSLLLLSAITTFLFNKTINPKFNSNHQKLLIQNIATRQWLRKMNLHDNNQINYLLSKIEKAILNYEKTQYKITPKQLISIVYVPIFTTLLSIILSNYVDEPNIAQLYKFMVIILFLVVITIIFTGVLIFIYELYQIYCSLKTYNLKLLKKHLENVKDFNELYNANHNKKTHKLSSKSVSKKSHKQS